MLVCVGMYLPLETTFAIFVGGVFKGVVELISAQKKHNAAQKARIENNGVLVAAGLIAGEALTGLVFAGLAFFEIRWYHFFETPGFGISLVVLAVIAWVLIHIPIRNAGAPEEPAPPTAVM